MEYKETPAEAAAYLRKAVPLMVKHSVAPNPCNYALWYSYVASKDEQLKTALDKTLDEWGTCPSVASNALFKKHIIMDELGDNEEIRKSLSGMVHELQTQVDTTLEGTNSFSDMLADYSEQLSSDDAKENFTGNFSKLLEVIEDLTRGTVTITNSTRSFQQQLQSAQNEINMLKSELAQSQEDATLDPLTGLYNRRMFDSVLFDAVAKKSQVPTSIIFVDIDHFKQLNDHFGHGMGDKVLQFFASVLSDNEVPGTAVRYGGEEFVILLQDQDAYAALKVAESIRKKVERLHLKDKKDGKSINNITASFGVAQLRDNETAEQLVERADQALYEAKTAGRNCCVVAE